MLPRIVARHFPHERSGCCQESRRISIANTYALRRTEQPGLRPQPVEMRKLGFCACPYSVFISTGGPMFRRIDGWSGGFKPSSKTIGLSWYGRDSVVSILSCGRAG